MNYKLNFAHRLTFLRKENNLSLAALGEILSISNQAVSLLEKGKNAPSFQVLCAISDHFNVRLIILSVALMIRNAIKIIKLILF